MTGANTSFKGIAVVFLTSDGLNTSLQNSVKGIAFLSSETLSLFGQAVLQPVLDDDIAMTTQFQCFLDCQSH
jgi:hypothetical protein